MRIILHKIAHLLKLNYGVCDSFYEGGKLMMSFVCSGCGERSGVTPCDEVIDRELKKQPRPTAE